MTVISLRGQEVIWNKDKNILLVNIGEPFYSAGKKYGWTGNSVGLGINDLVVHHAMKTNATIGVWVGNKPTLYYIRPEKIIELVERYQSYYKTEDGTVLYVVGWNNFESDMKEKQEVLTAY